ncbi:hypothetical protein N4G70_12770 [Streptomyces sp. ASQP_92]|uniref:hypothetical protein n=1 Tax=Streptomyces sp. ASQP_92 TaxID=2979116 RepID=UPI0021BEBEE6|nr:hypothetical protein [Streptomyces sp. ASQP_92]MCT9089737.1 hypothetical protein [Streptomyces sp. ASQP_92]
MSTQSRTEEKFSLALESIQSKRRIERVMEAANALLDRYTKQYEPEERLRLAFELIRRNFTEEVSLSFGDISFTTDEKNSGGESGGKTSFRCDIVGPEGRSGTLTAFYTAPGSMGLTDSEWLDAMRLLAGISGLGVGGYVTCSG